MPRMLHKPTPSGSARKVFIATPTYGDVGSGYAFAMFHVELTLKGYGIDCEIAIYSGDCHVDDARNRLVRDFLETDCTDLFFIDADMRFEPDSISEILQYNRDIVAATYPLKQEGESFPVRFLDRQLYADEDGLIEVESVPTGFLCIRRNVLEDLASKAEKFMPKSDKRSPLPCIFERQINDGMRWGGDYTFCRKARAAGYKIYLDPDHYFEHAGEHQYAGRCSSWIKKANGIKLPGLQDVIEGSTKESLYTELFNEWDNQYALSPAGLCALSELVRQLPNGSKVLETGSGLSTLVMAASNPGIEIESLETDVKWIDKIMGVADSHHLKNITVYNVPLVDGWYDIDLLSDYDLVLIDGPKRADGDRAIALEYCTNAQYIFVDDAEDNDHMDPVSKFCDAANFDLYVLGTNRRFAIGKKS